MNIISLQHGLSSRTLTISLLSGVLLICSACSDFRRAIGTEKSSPDEFEVVVRPPLSLPPFCSQIYAASWPMPPG